MNHLVKSEKLTGFLDAVWKVQAGGLILLTFLSFFPSWFHLEEYLFFALLLIALGATWLDEKSVWVRTSIDLPLLLFVGWVLLTIPFANDPAYSFAEWRKLVAQVMVFYWAVLVLRAQDSKALTHGVLAAVVIGTAALCAYALTDFVAQGGTWRDRFVRARAPSSDFQWLSTYMLIAIPMMVVAGMVFRARWQRLLSWVTAALALVTLFVSYTRAGWLGLLAQGFALGFFIRRRWIILGTVLFCLGLLLGLLVLTESGYQQQTFSFNTFYYRIATWGLITDEIAAHPVFGIGYGSKTYMMRFGDYQESHDAAGSHSLFFMVAMGSGVPALVFLVWMLSRCLWELLQRAKATPESFWSTLRIGIALMVLGFAIRNVFDYMFAGSLASLFWILVAAGLSEAKGRRKMFLTD